MIRIALLSTALCFAAPAAAQMPNHHNEDHQNHDDHAGHDHSEDMSMAAPAPGGGFGLSRTPEIQAALASGGGAAVVDVLGVVCDFCAKAMNKTFGKRAEVAGVYVDLDHKTLNLVFKPDQSLTDDMIRDLVIRAGYKTVAIRRSPGAQSGGGNAADPS